MKNPTNDQIFKAIERITGFHIVCFHDEAKNYAFKSFNEYLGQYWHTLDIGFVNGIAVYIK